MGALSTVKVLSNEASRNSCRKPCCSSLQGSLPPCRGTMCLPSCVHLVTSQAVPKKPLSAHATKLLPIFTRKALTGLQSVAASNVLSFSSFVLKNLWVSLSVPGMASRGADGGVQPPAPPVQLQLASVAFHF